MGAQNLLLRPDADEFAIERGCSSSRMPISIPGLVIWSKMAAMTGFGRAFW
jgi:hypothetical protein